MSRDCKHGQLARSCEICEKDAEIEKLRIQRAEYGTRACYAEEQLSRAVKLLQESIKFAKTYPVPKFGQEYIGRTNEFLEEVGK